MALLLISTSGKLTSKYTIPRALRRVILVKLRACAVRTYLLLAPKPFMLVSTKLITQFRPRIQLMTFSQTLKTSTKNKATQLMRQSKESSTTNPAQVTSGCMNRKWWHLTFTSKQQCIETPPK